MKTFRNIIAILVASLALSACSSSPSTTVEKFYRAMAEMDYTTAEKYSTGAIHDSVVELAKSEEELLKSSDTESIEAFRKHKEEKKKFGSTLKFSTTTTSTTDSEATVILTASTSDTEKYDIRVGLEKKDGEWKVLTINNGNK